MTLTSTLQNYLCSQWKVNKRQILQILSVAVPDPIPLSLHCTHLCHSIPVTFRPLCSSSSRARTRSTIRSATSGGVMGHCLVDV